MYACLSGSGAASDRQLRCFKPQILPVHACACACTRALARPTPAFDTLQKKNGTEHKTKKNTSFS
jgi:hypothetical protein